MTTADLRDQDGRHTPGPWDCTGCLFPDDNLGGVYYRLQAEGMDARGANARLISAAPDLLEELEQQADGTSTIIALLEGQASAVAASLRGMLRMQEQAARAAIAKATGAA